MYVRKLVLISLDTDNTLYLLSMLLFLNRTKKYFTLGINSCSKLSVTICMRKKSYKTR